MSLFLPNTPQFFPLPIEATVVETITELHKGKVKCQRVLWSARLFKIQLRAHFTPGETVYVIGREGNTLLVQTHQDLSIA